jgi:hypothetical protein
MWLCGHWHFAFRHGHVKSPLADTIFAALPGWLDPLHRKQRVGSTVRAPHPR